MVQNNCNINYYGSTTCSLTGNICPSRSGDCTVNCINSYACNQTKMLCSQGNCITNCDYSTSCRNLIANCSGGNCLINCEEIDTCQYSNIECSSGNCTLNCRGEGSCDYSTVLCSPYTGQCNVYCESYSVTACQFSEYTCQTGGNCVFYFARQTIFRTVGHFVIITCRENSTCNIVCAYAENLTAMYHIYPHLQSGECSYSNITCPRESGRCTVECSGFAACSYSNISCGQDADCLSCSGIYSCLGASVIFPNESKPVMNCIGLGSCSPPS